MGMKRGHDTTVMDPTAGTAHTVLCCSCGVPMAPNQTMRCAQCLKAEVSIVEGISRQVALPHCRNCGRYSKPGWVACEPESRELLGLCLKRIKGLGKEVRLVDAAFIWTEEHSKRIRVKITVQKEVANSSVLQQTMVVEFQVVNQQCEECQKSFTPHTFNATVQVRQKVSHRRTFCMLEQMILKHDAHEKVISMKENREGLDFHFAQKSHAQRFCDFVGSCVPTSERNSRHLCSHDMNSNVYNFKYTIMAELCPICQDDVVVVPKGHSNALSGSASLMLCHKVSNGVRLLDPLTLRGYDISPAEYWKRPLTPVLNRVHLTEFIVLNVEFVDAPEAGTKARHHIARGAQLADIEVARASDFGVNDDRHIVRSHLGHLLRAGNRALGYDLRAVNVSGIDTEGFEGSHADFFLVKRFYKKRRGNRAWQLRRLEFEKEETNGIQVNDEQDMEAICQDMEEDAELRKGILMYRNPESEKKKSPDAAAAPVPAQDDEDEEDDAPEVPLAELLEGLTLKDEIP